MGWFSDFVAAPAATLSGTVQQVVEAPASTISAVADVAAEVVNNPIINPVNMVTSGAIEATTGITGGQQLLIGAGGGLAAMTPVVGAGLQTATGAGLATVGSWIAPAAPLSAGIAQGATVDAAAPTLTATAPVAGAGIGATLAGAKPAIEAIQSVIQPKAESVAEMPKVQAPPAPVTNNMMIYAGAAMLGLVVVAMIARR